MMNKSNKILFKGQTVPAAVIGNKNESVVNTKEQEGNDFWPGSYFLRLIKSRPFRCLLLIYDASTLEELKEIWTQWEKCAICAQYSAFSENEDRRYLLQFAEHFSLLTEALHFAVVQRRKDKNKELYAMEQGAIYKDSWNKNRAYTTIGDFAQRYSPKKAQAYLWSVFECALAAENIFTVEKKNILFDYECLLCIAKAPYRLLKRYAALLK